MMGGCDKLHRFFSLPHFLFIKRPRMPSEVVVCYVESARQQRIYYLVL